ncbi:GNAT family N-acetyltransferase [Streptomyces longwoodensis]|uniref:GNAT family N-acetyltransferase n=1 Tax=Streptomyces longwoodensis TaxID=68231 RepID=UPI0033E522EC
MADDPSIQTDVLANFRGYLMGWGGGGTEGEVDLFRSGLAAPQFNGVVRLRSGTAVDQAVASARSRLARIPWWWWVGPDSPDGTASALARAGGRLLAVMPIMTRLLDRPGGTAPEVAPAQTRGLSGLRVEEVRGVRGVAEVVRTYRTSMGLAPSLQAALVRAETGRGDNADIVRLAAVLDGQVVGSTVVVTTHGVAGVFLVHVAEACRRRGVGTALTAEALRVGRERGTRLAALVASAAGESLYRRAGFTAVCQYRLFGFPD